MRLLGRYVFREIVTSAVLGSLLATFVIFLQGVDKLFDVLVRSNGVNVKTVLYLFTLAMPPVLPLTIPFGVLVGILIGLGRMSSDGEITAMRAAGVSSRRVIAPVLLFAFVAAALAAFCSLRLTPLSIRESTVLINRLLATQVSAEIQPRVFDESFPSTIVYVGDVRPGAMVLWRNVFLADVKQPEQRKSGLQDKADGPMITVAREAIALPDPVHNRIQLSLRNVSQHEVGKDRKAQDVSFPIGDMALEVSPPSQKRVLPSAEMNTRQLWHYRGPDLIEARIELHRRLSLPIACLALALVGIPLGISSRKGGKSSGYVTAILLAFFCYHLTSITLIGVAKQRTLPVPLAIWLPDAVFIVAGLILIFRMERPGDRDILSDVTAWIAAAFGALKARVSPGGAKQSSVRGHRWPVLPQIVDTYILSHFLYYLVLLLVSFVSMTLVYNFFELMGDVIRNRIPLMRVFTYLLFLTPMLIYKMLPISVLVAVLVTFGVLTKQNEITAFKACGVSLYRLAVPILITSFLLSLALFGFDHYYIPGANRKQEAIRNEIKGKAVQTYYRPDRKWIMGAGSRIYYYRYFDMSERAMLGVSVFELDPATFHLTRQISADRAHWNPQLKTWVFENGWFSDFKGLSREGGTKEFPATTFSELTEPPEYFLTEAMQDKQMNFRQLDRYIHDLQQRGFDTVKLRVQFYRKFAVPLIVLIMALIAIPFSFLVGNRGAMAGIGVSLVIALSYWGIDILFAKLGDVNQLPPMLAAWAPDAVFSLAGLYLLLRLRS
jgi:LPS export ABC transporter permease LptG/LPS export ABC transporter permease LptF